MGDCDTSRYGAGKTQRLAHEHWSLTERAPGSACSARDGRALRRQRLPDARRFAGPSLLARPDTPPTFESVPSRVP
jgi:hypothetical protein